MERDRIVNKDLGSDHDWLRTAVSNVINENYDYIDKYDECGRWIREFVGAFLDEHEGEIPDTVPIGPTLQLRTRDVAFESVFLNQGIRVAMNVVQEKMARIWFTHCGLVVNAIEHNLRR